MTVVNVSTSFLKWQTDSRDELQLERLERLCDDDDEDDEDDDEEEDDEDDDEDDELLLKRARILSGNACPIPVVPK